MTDKTSTTDLQAKLVDVITQLQHGIEITGVAIKDAAPAAMNGLLDIQRVDGMIGLVHSVMGLMIAIVLFIITKTSYDYSKNHEKYSRSEREAYGQIAGFIGVIGVVVTILVILSFDLWDIIAIIKPQLALAHSALHKAGITL